MTRPVPHSPVSELRPREELESELFERLREGDTRALEALYRAYMEPLCACAYSYVQSQASAEEVVYDLFYHLWERRQTLATPRNVRAYLYRAARNTALNHLRRRRAEEAFKGRLRRQMETARATPPVAEQQVQAEGLAKALVEAIAELPERCREVFTLTRDGGLSYAEVANVLGLSPKTVENHMTRALGQLRKRLAPWLSA